MTNWGIMSSDSNRNAKGKLPQFALIFSLFLLSEVCAFASPYSQGELREVESSEEAKIRDFRNQETTQLRIALGRRSPTNRRADLYFRLAEIYLESYRAAFLLEGRAHEKRLERRIEDKFIDRTYSRPNLYAGIKACQEIVGFHIPYDKMDQVYYFMGFYYGELEEKKQSIHYFTILTQNYPRSRFTGVAYKELGDYAFNDAQFQKSKTYYEQAIQKAPVEMRPPMLHKLAWSYYRVKFYDRAVATMKDAIAQSTRFGDRYLPLKEESLRDLATIMTESGRVEEAIRYFEEVAGDHKIFPQILEKLGRQYERNVEIAKAIHVYETLLKIRPESESAFRVHVKLIELDIKQKNFVRALRRIKSLELVSGGETETQTAAQNIRVLVRKTAVDHHQTYRKTKNHTDLEIADGFYTAYLETFLKKNDSHKEIPEIQMYLAEVKRELGKSREVAELYRKVVLSKDSRYAKDAGVLWTASLAEAMKKAPQRSGTEPSELEKEFIEAADLLQSNLGNTKEAKEAELRAAQVQAGYKSTRSDAIDRIKAILSRSPKSPQALIAAQLWLQLCLDEKPHPDMNELSTLVKELRGNSGLLEADRLANQGKLKAALDEQDSKLKIARIAALEKNREYSAAAKGYEEYAAASNQREVAEKAYGNAVGLYLKEEDGSEAILALAAIWTRRYPQSPKAVDSLRTAATNALIRGKFDLSAKYFEVLGTDFKDQDSLETAGRILEAIGDAAHAQQCWSRYLDMYKSSPNRWRVALILARSLEGSMQESEASRTYRICAGGPPAFQSECNSRLADLYLRSRDSNQAKALYKMVASSGPQGKSAPVSPYVGYARYKLAELAETEAKFDQLKFPEAQLQKALSQRLNFLEPLSRSYQSAVQVGGPWGVASLHRLALWATHFADEVDHIEAPSSLDGARLEKFRKDLRSVSVPLREKAKATWNEAYTKANNSLILSPALPEIADYLADYKVSVPGRAQGPHGKLHLAGLALDGGSDGKVTALGKVRDRLIKNAQDGFAWVDYGNLLWGDGKPLLAKIAYERALGLNQKNALALNNLAVVKLMSEGEENWLAAAEGGHLLEEALKLDDFFLSAKMNLASLMNYYRIFGKAKTLWDQVLFKNSKSIDANDGYGIALQGTGNLAAAASSFKKSEELGADSSRFVAVYHESARQSLQGQEGAEKCYDTMESLGTKLSGFEGAAVDHLKRKCESWKTKN